MRVRFITKSGEVLEKRYDLCASPMVGQRVILGDDLDYEVTGIDWDLLDKSTSWLVVTLKRKST